VVTGTHLAEAIHRLALWMGGLSTVGAGAPHVLTQNKLLRLPEIKKIYCGHIRTIKQARLRLSAHWLIEAYCMHVPDATQCR
jgi:hypothetical protein